jgi:hypothetical protein
MIDHLDPLRIGFRRLGVVLTVVSAALTGLFGITMSSNWLLAILIAVGLMCATVCSAYAWPFVADYARRRSYVTAGVAGLFAVLSTFADLTTNFGSIAWQRGTNIEEATVSAVKYDDSRAKVEENRANLELWKNHLAKLEGENAWIATVTADALRANLEAADEAIRQESKRGGCGPKCLKLKETKAELEKNIALAEQKADLTTKIEATQKLVDKYREESATVVKVDSAAQKQNVSLASMFTLSLDPTVEAQHWTDKGVAWLVALFFTFGAMGANFLGWNTKTTEATTRAMTETHRAISEAIHPTKPQDAKTSPTFVFSGTRGDDARRIWEQALRAVSAQMPKTA